MAFQACALYTWLMEYMIVVMLVRRAIMFNICTDDNEDHDEDHKEDNKDEDNKEDGDRSAATDPTDSTGNGSLLQRIFLTNRPKVASKPSLDDIEEEEDGLENDTDETGSSVDSPDSDSERTESDSDTIDFDATNWDDTASTICDLDFNPSENLPYFLRFVAFSSWHKD
ncbi:hypothetical protein BD309DRAFT_1022321 [Dichomitus squalens]|nr:hypothetical protein BD309DRAFT_1022321 [Dichomitus squalens]